jgi:hypothetical protein
MKAVLGVFKGHVKNTAELQEKIRIAARKVVSDCRDKKPQTIVHVMVAP